MPDTSQKLTMTVAICAHNEQAWIGKTLESLMQQTRLPDEVIVVDNVSTDDPAQVVQHIIARYPHRNLRLVHEPNKGLHHARDTGWRASGSDIVVTTDADITFPPDWLEIIAQKFSDPAINAVTGICRYTDAYAIANWVTGVNDEQRAKAEHTHLNGGNSAVRRHILDEVDGYKGKPINDFEDQWLSQKIQQAGYHIRFMPDIKVWHTFRRFNKEGIWGYIKYIFFYTAENIYPDHLSDESPYSVAVVIPGHKSGASLTRCLESLARQTPAPHDIIVVDCDPQASAAAPVSALAAKYPHMTIRRLSAPGKTDVEAREIGWRAASSDLIVQASADEVFPDGWLSMIHAAFMCSPQLGALGGEICVGRHAPLRWIMQTLTNMRIRWHSRRTVVLVPMMTVYKRDALEKVSAISDPHLPATLQTLGYTLRLKPELYVDRIV